MKEKDKASPELTKALNSIADLDKMEKPDRYTTITVNGKDIDLKVVGDELRIYVEGTINILPRASNSISITVT